MRISISSLMKQSDIACDYIPIVSTFSNVVDMFTKFAIDLISRTSKKGESAISKNKYFSHIKNKSYKDCALLLIPGVNIKVARQRFKKTEAFNKEKPTTSPKETHPIKTAPARVSSTVLPHNENHMQALIQFFDDPTDLLEAFNAQDLKRVNAVIDEESKKADKATLKRLSSGENDEKKFSRAGYVILFPQSLEDLDYPVVAERNWKTMQWSYKDLSGKTIEFDPKTIQDSSKCILLQKHFLATPKQFSSKKESGGSYHAVEEKKGATPPFYHERRMGRGYCTKHAINAAMGHHQIAAKQIWTGSNEGMNYIEVMAKLKENGIYSFQAVINSGKLIDLNQRDRFILETEDHAHNPHAIAFRKDPQTGEWWRIDSLSVYDGKLKQEVVNLEVETYNHRVICLSDKEELKTLVRQLLQKQVNIYNAGKAYDVEEYSEIRCTLFDALKMVVSEDSLRAVMQETSALNYGRIARLLSDDPEIAKRRQMYFEEYVQKEIDAVNKLLEAAG